MNNIGNLGEQVFSYKMREAGYIVNNVSGNPEYWTKDIDFFCTNPETGATRSFEVKYDTRLSETGNLFLELSNVHSKDGLGWFRFCQADFIAYGDAKSRTFYIIPTKELHERVKQLPERMSHCGQDSIGLLVKLQDIMDLVKTI